MGSTFVNRTSELDRLERWWREGSQAAMVWGRRRVGKTALIQEFGRTRPLVFHTGAGRPEAAELAALSQAASPVMRGGMRDLRARPYSSWDDALDDLAERAREAPTLLVLDEFPEIASSSPALAGIIRAFLDRSRGRTGLRLLLCGSAVRHMQALQEQREPLYGRFDLSLRVDPFTPHESALMLPRLSPGIRALVYGLVGGMPLYLSWWEQNASVETNVRRLFCEPAARMLTEGDLVLGTDFESGDYSRQVLHAVASGRTQYTQIRDYLRSEPSRTLDRLIELGLLERLVPAGEPNRTRRRTYRIVDPFLRLHLGVVARFRTEIERGLGPSIAPVLMGALDDHMGGVWEEVFRRHLRRLAAAGTLVRGAATVEIGPWWNHDSTVEIDAVALAGRSRRPVLAGEAKWSRRVDGSRAVVDLERKVAAGLGGPSGLAYAVCARDEVVGAPPGTLLVTASDIFDG